jgi:hypothetical protein
MTVLPGRSHCRARRLRHGSSFHIGRFCSGSP